jgi:hypothetical protein
LDCVFGFLGLTFVLVINSAPVIWLVFFQVLQHSTHSFIHLFICLLYWGLNSGSFL